MSFGKSPGPPASHQQLETLLELVQRAGHEGFRDARGPLGLNQRQAGGRFTRDEAEDLIARLEAEEDERAARSRLRVVRSPGEEPPHEGDPALKDVPSEALAAELRRRGWRVSDA